MAEKESVANAIASHDGNADLKLQSEYDKAEKRWNEKLAKTTAANLKCEELSSDDFEIRINAKDY